MDSYTVSSWYAIDENGNEISGATHGAFHTTKDQRLTKVWVMLDDRYIEAPGRGPEAKLEFKIRHALEIDLASGKKKAVEKKILLIAKYSDRIITKTIDELGNITIIED